MYPNFDCSAAKSRDSSSRWGISWFRNVSVVNLPLLRAQTCLELRLPPPPAARNSVSPSDTCLSLRVLEPKAGSVLFLLPVVGFSLPLLPIPIPQPLPPAWQLVQDTEFCPFHRGTLRVRENSCPVRGGGEASCFHPLRTGFPNFPIPAPVEQKASGPVCWAGPSKGTHQRLFIESSRQARHSIKNPFPFVPPGPQLSPLSCDGRSQL